MKIAVASQNRREVTGHAGRCRRFWLFDSSAPELRPSELLELPEAAVGADCHCHH